MNIKELRLRRWNLVLLGALPILLFALLFERASWKSKVRQVYKGAVFALQFSPDGQTLASAGESAKNFSYSGELSGLLRVEMLSAKSLSSVRTLPLLPAASPVAFSPDLKRIVTVPYGLLSLHLVDLTSGTTLWKENARPQNDRETLVGLAFSPRGDEVSVCFWWSGGDSGFKGWYSVEGQKLKEAPFLSGDYQMDEPTCAAFSPDSQSLVLGDQENVLELLNTRSGKTIWLQKKYVKTDTGRWIEAIIFSPDGKTIASGHSDNSVCLWDARNGKLLRTLDMQPNHAHSMPLQLLGFSPDSTMLARGSQDGIIVVSSTRNGATLHVSSSRKAVTALAFAPDGKHLAAGYADGKIALWRIR